MIRLMVRGRRSAGPALLLAFLVSFPPPTATAAPPRIATQVVPSVIHIGDTVTVSVTITPGAGLQPFAPPASAGRFTVLGATPPRDAAGGARSLEIYLTTFDTGSQTIPPIALGVVIDGRIDSVRTSPWRVSVESLLPAGAAPADSARIKAARPPLDVPQQFRWGVAFGYLVVLAGLALAGLWLYRRWRAGRPRLPLPGRPAVPPRPPLEVALGALRDIEGKGYLTRGLVKAHYSEVLDVGRGFIEGELSVEALDRTSFELLAALGRTPLGADERRELARLLDEADLVKFARWNPPVDSAGALIGRVRSWIQRVASERAAARAAQAAAAAKAAGGARSAPGATTTPAADTAASSADPPAGASRGSGS